METFDAIILIVPQDFKRLQRLYPKLGYNLPVRNVCFIGNQEVGRLLKEADLGENFIFMDEDSILPFEKIRTVFRDILKRDDIPRGVIGWYYQQFLKLSYANVCQDQYYLAWDGDTIPVRQIEMFQDGKPCLDLKKEYNQRYFDTLKELFPEMHKVIERSFISEHMLFRTDIVRHMIKDMEAAGHLCGEEYYERILLAIDKEKLLDSSFSEFETYGTYVTYRYPDEYLMRKWTSYRHCGQYFRPEDIREDEMEWLGRDFHAITFEKGQIPEVGYEFFRDRKYQEKLSAKAIVEIIQENLVEGDYRESWD